MNEPIAFMFTFTTYGSWLRGEKLGWVDKGIVYPPDITIEQEDYSKLKYTPYFFPSDKLHYVGDLICYAVKSKLNTDLYALTVRNWHTHFVIGKLSVNLEKFVQVIKLTVRAGLKERRKIWTRKYDKRFCFNVKDMQSRIQYIQQHNIQMNLPANPWE